ncbi:hypothetical protein HJC23_013020 [Cyclotella cryptica]|uniref:Uncharacterized protein n=1 Tax=Cyclotella cryptica TaxID=29204 RepID=A0ABD3QFW1_9STRA
MLSEALEKGCDILSRIGDHIPRNPSNEDLDHHIRKTQSLIRGITENDILNYSHMTDTNKLDAMRFLAQLEIITVMVKPTLHPFVTLKMVRLTILHGLSPVSPIGFVYFGSLLAKRGNIKAGHQFTLLAKALLEKLDARDVAGEVICVATEVQFFLEPVQAASNFFAVQGEPAAMRGGNIHWACMNRLHYCCTMFWTCSNLAVVSEMFAEASQFMREQHHRTSLLFLLPIQKIILTLIGSEAETLADNELLRSIQENKNPRHLMMFSFHVMYRSFLLDNNVIDEYALKYYQFHRSSWFLFFGDAVQTFFVGLVAFQSYRETCKSIWLEKGETCIADMKLWAKQGASWNFRHKLLLLEAEELYSKGSFENAQVSYMNAITLAKSHKFMNDEALACELAAMFYLGTGNVASSLDHFRLAQEKYHKWGAFAKADRLLAFIHITFIDID